MKLGWEESGEKALEIERAQLTQGTLGIPIKQQWMKSSVDIANSEYH